MKIFFEYGRKYEFLFDLNFPVLINQLKIDEIWWKNETLIDSGGYQIILQGMQIKPEEVLKKYKQLAQQSNKLMFFSLDYPTLFDHVDNRNFDWFEFLWTKFEEAEKIIPIVHMYTKSDLDFAIDFYRQYTNYLAMGGFVASSKNDVFLYTLPFYVYVKRKVNWLHVLGMPGAKTKTLFLDANQLDTSIHIHLSGLRRVIFPDGRDYHPTNKKFKERVNELIDFLEKTNFPYEIKFDSYKDVAKINVWVLQYSEEMINEKYYYYLRSLKRLGEDSLIEEMKLAFKSAREILNSKK
ncbi:putative queuine tRNA-ribosyltransferase [Sulfolobales Beppu rod-shaped virus 1]|uniref:Putative queuine tRNA-ribosyltransferase n=1 Tax=Sulfolobales Beppu rod-shaped virus 1 TaxID=2493121 RepID=A0A3S8NF82_9VIRU|nr:putative queuine tRNA-ribosyltransferase [Sulfolobales Beppu rod-shaped virus 1]AZI75908.1 putative queuine tRNA-ribosyltransferase [Sulfolobales Beppu rod-shaped virus 1]